MLIHALTVALALGVPSPAHPAALRGPGRDGKGRVQVWTATRPRFRIVAHDDPVYYPSHNYQDRTVVGSRPLRPEPRFVFKDRDGAPQQPGAQHPDHRQPDRQKRPPAERPAPPRQQPTHPPPPRQQPKPNAEPRREAPPRPAPAAKSPPPKEQPPRNQPELRRRKPN